MIKIYSNGLTMGIPPKFPSLKKHKRGKTTGWSKSSTRSNTAFLYSVDSNKLDGYGVAFTLTLRDLPETPAIFSAIRSDFLQVMARMGVMRYHWVMEWQRRGTPHLHGCLYFPYEPSQNILKGIKSTWCNCVGDYFALQKAQDIQIIKSAVGWLKYLAKHGSRSEYHYQRTSKPTQWESSGRVWGKGGEWPTRVTEHQEGDYFHRLRRVIRNWRIADARATESPKRIRQARRVLLSGDRSSSTVRGMSEWVPEHVAFRMIAYFESNN